MSDGNYGDEIHAARERIARAYDPAIFADVGSRFGKLLASHFQSVLSGNSAVLNWNTPDSNLQRAAAELLPELRKEFGGVGQINPGSNDATSVAERFGELLELTLSRGHNLHSPRYLGHQVPATVPVAGYFDAIGQITNQVNAVYEMGPWITAIERAVSDRLAGYLGWKPNESAAVVTHGGSLGNLTGLLAARNVAIPGCSETGIPVGVEPVFVCQQDAHYSLSRAAGILGLGTKQVLKAALDDRRRMDPGKLDEQLSRLKGEGKTIIAVGACACSTPIGAFDPLQEIADLCEKHRVWLHVDAAHGGGALLSTRHRHLLDGLGRADSLVWDAHKMMFVPALCAFLFFKNRKHSFEAFQQEAPYLFDPSTAAMGEYDSGLRTVECTKRGLALGLWGIWSLFGPELFGDLVDVTFDLGQQFFRMLQEADDFTPLHEPECNIVAFSYDPPESRTWSPEQLGKFLRELRVRVIQSGEFYFVQTTLDGRVALRVTLINPLTTVKELELFLETIRRHGREMLRERGGN